MIRTVEMDFQFQPTIPAPPETPEQLYAKACSADETTVNAWREIWRDQIKANHKTHGPFAKNGIGKLYKQFHLKPCIIVGSGPSLKMNVDQLKNTGGIPVLSCLHNYQFLEDRGITPDYYVTLDAGPITIKEVSEGGKKTADEYFESTKNKKLIAFIGSHPDLIAKWKGEVIWFMAPIPDQQLMEEVAELEPFYSFVSSGGNVLGASFYIAKAIMGANPIVFVGADFSFANSQPHTCSDACKPGEHSATSKSVTKFHAWDSSYDKNVGNVMCATDVFGNKVLTWQSYNNFRCWFESRMCKVDGIYINATEGGILGAYPNGNIAQIKQMSLEQVIKMYSISDMAEVRDAMLQPSKKHNAILF